MIYAKADRSHEAQDTDGETSYKHELELTESEQALLAEAESVTGAKVIVLYSSSNTFEMANLEDDEKIDAILWMGRMGDGGIDAVGEILSGKVNPSGKTVDEWTRDFTNDPTYANKIVTAYNDEDGNSLRVTMGSDFMDNMYESMMPGALDLGSVDYEEDIYLGYKWYETYWAEASADESTLTPSINGTAITATEGSTAADDWYDYNVVYPYGYGLSYTDFSYELESLTADTKTETNLLTSGASLSDIFNSTNANGAKTITAKVKVTNTGSTYSGKETVEVYVEAPYTAGGVEKPYYTLVGFAKTDTLAPAGEEGDSQTLDITFNIQDFASFDYSDANGNGEKVYELDPGSYTVHVMGSSSHENISTAEDTDHNDAYESATFSIDGGSGAAVIMDLDDWSEKSVEAVFSDPSDDYYSNAAGAVAGTMYTPLDEDEDGTITSTLLSRADFDGTRPTAPTSTIGEKTVAGGKLNSANCGYSVDDETGEASHSSKLEAIREWWMSDMYMYADTNTSIDSGAVWAKTDDDIPTGWTQGTGSVGANGMYAITFSDMAGVALDVGEENSKWDDFMNRLAREEILLSFCGPGV